MKERLQEQAKVVLLPLDSITPSPFQARTVFNACLLYTSRCV